MTAAALQSPLWPQLEHLRPVLRPHVRLHRQHFRGGLWYLLEDGAGGKFFRFAPPAYALIGLMDGRRSLHEIHELAARRLGDDMPAQDEVVQLLAQLHAAGAITTDATPDLAELGERARLTARRKLLMAIRNPLGVRIPLLNIDPFLSALLPLVRPLLGGTGFLLWLALLGAGILTAGIHWRELTSDVVDRILSAQGLALLALAYPVVKLFHELGHGLAIKRWGGRVREVGIMLLVFMPVPYVDATAATGFASKRARVVVGAAGVMMELALASLAVLAWTGMEDGPLRALMFNVMLIGGVSTLFFNGNPLVRFDGYYVLSDLIEVPNLGQRSGAYLAYLVRRHLFGLPHAVSPVTAPGERPWLAVYAVLSFLYRIVIMIGIALLVSGKFFFVGIALAIWTVVMMALAPLAKAVTYLLSAGELEERRPRALLAGAGLALALAGPLLLLPLPQATLAEGVVWMPGEMRVVTGADGWVADLHAAPGEAVEAGQPLLTLENPAIATRRAIVEAELREARVRLVANAGDPVRAEVERERLRSAQGELGRIEERLAALQVAAAASGRFVPVAAGDLQGRWVPQGTVLGHVLHPQGWVVRVAVPQRDIELVDRAGDRVAVRFASDLGRALEGRVVARTPRATLELPSPALGTAGGGRIPSDPAMGGTRALGSVFLLDVAVPAQKGDMFFGERVHVRFDGGRAPLAAQAWRVTRQLFLDRFGL